MVGRRLGSFRGGRAACAWVGWTEYPRRSGVGGAWRRDQSPAAWRWRWTASSWTTWPGTWPTAPRGGCCWRGWRRSASVACSPRPGCRGRPPPSASRPRPSASRSARQAGRRQAQAGRRALPGPQSVRLRPVRGDQRHLRRPVRRGRRGVRRRLRLPADRHRVRRPRLPAGAGGPELRGLPALHVGLRAGRPRRRALLPESAGRDLQRHRPVLRAGGGLPATVPAQPARLRRSGRLARVDGGRPTNRSGPVRWSPLSLVVRCRQRVRTRPGNDAQMELPESRIDDNHIDSLAK